MLRLSRWTAGIQRHTDLAGRHAGRYAALFATFERWLGVPALQGAMFAVAHLPVRTADRLAISCNTISACGGPGLPWLFAAASDAAIDFDYAVTVVSSAAAERCPSPCFDTIVTVARLGDGQFSGRSSARVGEFDSGDAMALRVTLANGEHAWARWDGRDETRTFRFRGPSPRRPRISIRSACWRSTRNYSTTPS